MKKILFLIHDLGPGGAEKVLVNLVNNMDQSKFDISLTVLFGGGVNERFLKPHIRYRAVFPKPFRGNSHLMKLFSPETLHRWLVKERYDIEVSYLEGPCARIISGCSDPDTKLAAWIHCTVDTAGKLAGPFRSGKEAAVCYGRFDRRIFVSEGVRQAFLAQCPLSGPSAVLYNTMETDRILEAGRGPVAEGLFLPNRIYLCGMGKLTANKGFDRLLRIHGRLRAEGYPVHTCILGQGEGRMALNRYIRENRLSDSVTMLGYQTNPYPFLVRCDLFICSSHSEGFSTAAAEALILGVPVCTVAVAGMAEMLGSGNEWGLVTENDEEALYRGIRGLLDDPALLAQYKEQAARRGRMFCMEHTVSKVEEMLESL